MSSRVICFRLSLSFIRLMVKLGSIPSKTKLREELLSSSFKAKKVSKSRRYLRKASSAFTNFGFISCWSDVRRVSTKAKGVISL